MSSNLIPMLQKALLRQQVLLSPVNEAVKPSPCHSDATLGYLSSLLLDEQDDDENMDYSTMKSYQDLLKELNDIVETQDSPREDHSKVESLDIHSMLMECAQAVSDKKPNKVCEMVEAIQSVAGPDSWAFFVAKALVARLTGCFQPYKAMILPLTQWNQVPTVAVTYVFTCEMILEICKGANQVHIIDYGIHLGIQWACLISAFSRRPEGPPSLRITGIESTQMNSQSKLVEYANSCGIQLAYDSIITDSWETANPVLALIKSKPEVLIVNCNKRMMHLAEDGTSLYSQRKLLLEKILNFQPNLFTISEVDVNLTGSFFLPRFKEILRFGTVYWDYFNTMLGEDVKPHWKKMIEAKFLDSVACEGPQRRGRPVSCKMVDARLRRTGFDSVPVSDAVYDKVQKLLGQYENRSSLGIARENNWVLVGWKTLPLIGMSAWKPRRKFYSECH